ncbi:low temperature requirement protein LtrA [Actinocorallia herbida]|uniref:Low temperature requirement protein LtrA n=1 Tax=Actinocorallia herbida TaxID=58109 RepID=A0A3N1D521_9ACTN|nr:low temperature requirement protein A [Actinocorallia herbida]ROO88556.1 low temperature requirement protein LtrA [Actinocorallia herbida]
MAYAWHKRMRARDLAEEHRAATPLELFFDLCFIVAVAQAGTSLHHAVGEGHVAHGVGAYLMVFFAIWWAWMNFTWFASAYDTDDVPYRLAVLIQITGSLIVAAGVARAFDDGDFTIMIVGYVVMRTALIGQWLRAAAADPAGRTTALRMAGGLFAVQTLWVAFLFLPESYRVPAWIAFAVLDAGVPVVAERAGRTSWHPRHIAERYGLFTLIMLGESVAAATLAFKAAFEAGVSVRLIVTGLGGVVIMSALWWLYFSRDPSGRLTDSRAGFIWGYGHYAVFAASAAVGAGLSVSAAHLEHETHVSDTVAAASVTLPVAVFLLALWVLHHHRTEPYLPLVLTIGFLAASTFTPAAVPLTALCLAALVAYKEVRTARARPVPAFDPEPA